MKLSIKENENTEFKESLTQLDKGLKSLTAMLNRSNSGTIYFGVKDDASVCGCQIGEKTFQDIRQRASVLIQPKIVLNIKKEVIDEKTIVIVSANGLDIPYSCDGRYYIRNVASDEKVDNYLLRKMFEIGDGDLIKHHESYLQDLTFNQFIEYNKQKGLHASNSNNFYKSKGLFTQESKFNYMSFLLSDQSNVSIKVVRFNGKDKSSFSERTEYGSKCLFNSVDEVMNAIKAINVTKIEIVDGLRKEIPLFDFDSFREAWINACMHNHWIDELPPAVYIFDDRIEVFSCGNKPFNLTDEQFFSGVSSPINKTLSDIFVSLRFSEQSGHGVPIIVSKYGREAFSFKSETVTVTIPFNYIPDFVLGRKMKEDQVNKLTTNQKNILFYLKGHPTATQVEVSDSLQISIQGVKKVALRLQELNLLERIGSKKDGSWQVKVY